MLFVTLPPTIVTFWTHFLYKGIFLKNPRGATPVETGKIELNIYEFFEIMIMNNYNNYYNYSLNNNYSMSYITIKTRFHSGGRQSVLFKITYQKV